MGKTTAVLRTVDLLRARDVRVGGFVTVEVRRDGRRAGFDIVDILSGVRRTMASESLRTQLMVGRYGVDPAFEEMAVKALEKSVEKCEVTVVDEIGPMELKMPGLASTLGKLLERGRLVLATVHYASRHPVARMAVERAGPHLYVLNESNRDKLPMMLAELLMSWIRLR